MRRSIVQVTFVQMVILLAAVLALPGRATAVQVGDLDIKLPSPNPEQTQERA
jgi:hypothetical protein